MQLRHCGGIGLAVGRADTDIDARRIADGLHMVRTAGAWKKFNGQHMRLAERDDVNLRHKPRLNAVGDEVCQLLLDLRHVRHAANFARAIHDTDQQHTARAIGESHERPHHLVR